LLVIVARFCIFTPVPYFITSSLPCPAPGLEQSRQCPLDGGAVTEEEAREIAAARASLDRGEGIPHEKVLVEFGLTLEDFWADGSHSARSPRNESLSVGKIVIWKDQAKAQLRAIDQPSALRILHALARYLDTGEGDVRRLQDIEPP
jgi:hypothetical protein